MRMAGMSDKGPVRADNEDRWLARTLPGGRALLAVADGLGGQAAGERAAQAVVDALAEYDPASGVPLEEMVRRAGRTILSEAARDPGLEGMGSTVTAVLVPQPSGPEVETRWVHVGDSRLYLYRAGTVRQVTRDQRLVQSLIDGGMLTEAQARTHPLRNMLDQCVGCPGLEPDAGVLAVRPGDLLLLTTDGLHDLVSAGTMAGILSAPGDLAARAGRLVAAALAAGSRDNVTAVLAEI